MTVTADASSDCWCCGRGYDEDHLFRLGMHPEVGVCANCVRFLARRARESADAHRRSPGSVVRGATAAAREFVIQRGWHQRGPLGRFLRALDSRLP